MTGACGPYNLGGSATTEESNARLLEKVTQQEEGPSILKSARLGMYLFRLRLMPWFFLSFASKLVVFFQN